MAAVETGLPPSWGRPTNPQRKHPTRRALPHLALAATFLTLYTAMAIARWHRAEAASWDLGIFTEAIRGWAQHGTPTVDIKGPGYNLLGDHWSPILATLAPAWWIWPSPVMLLTAQAALFAWSTGIVSDTAARFLGRTNGLLIGVAYGLSWGLQAAINVEFHEIAFAVPLLAMTGRQLLLRRWQRAACWALPLLLVKEDLGVTVAMVGILIWSLGKNWRLGAATILTGIGATLLETLTLIPAFNPHHHYDYWAMTPHGHHSLWWWAGWQTTQLVKWKTLAWTLGITALLALRSPLALLAAPTLAWRMLAANPSYWNTAWHYSAVLMPAVFLAALDALVRLETSRRHSWRALAHYGPPVLATAGIAICFSWPLGIGLLADPVSWRVKPANAPLSAAVRLVPPGVTVESWHPGLAALAARDDAFWVGGDPQPPQYALLTPAGGDISGIVGFEESLHRGARYRLIFGRDGVALLQLQR